MTKNQDRKLIKINKKFLHPIDIIFYNIIKKISPAFKKFNFSPNMITSLSLIITLIGIYAFYIDLRIISSLLIFLGYFFDVMDGYYARKYNLVSKFGDYYDHISDLFKVLVIYYILFKKKKNNIYFINYLLLLFFFSILTLIDTGSVHSTYKYKSESKSLNFTKLFSLDKKYISYTKYFGPATLFLLLSIIVLIY